MLKFSACIEMLFGEVDFNDRIAAAKHAGLSGVEFWNWSNKDLDSIKQLKEELDIPVTACTVSSANADVAKNWGSIGLVDDSNHDFFIKALEESIEAVKKLDIQNLIVTVGPEIKDQDRCIQHKNIVSGLKKAAHIVEKENISLVVEPLNVLVDHKGYYLYSSKEGFDIINEVDSPNVKLLYDIYHQQITEGNLIQTILSNIDLIGHFHVADVPGRNEPGTGEINYKNVFNAIYNSNYNGYIGLEYKPKAPSSDTIGKLFEIADF